MNKRRSGVPMLVLILGGLAAGTSVAHVDETGDPRIDLKAIPYDTSNGYFQYMLRWSLRGKGHNFYDSRFLRIERAYNNQGPWRTYVDVDEHVGQSYPMPLHSWYRVRAGGQPCILDACALSVESPKVWIPAKRCLGNGIPGLD